jgi:uncharacterized protein YllA (UPF0747 family)
MQDTLLPTVAYVGGPAELAYLAQAERVYERILGRMPVIVPRASFTVVDGPMERLLRKHELSLTEVCAGPQPLREKMASRYLPPDLAALFERTNAGLHRDVEALQAGLAKLDPTLVDAAKNSVNKMQYQLANLERKAKLAVQQRSDLIERDATRLEEALCPGRTLQERHQAGISLLARYGTGLLQQLYEAVSLDSAEHSIVSV